MTDGYDFGDALTQWVRIPVDDFGYVAATELRAMDPRQRAQLLREASRIRFDPAGWRNKGHGLIDFMDPPRWAGKIVMDFGAGLGLDSMQFAAAGARVVMADINPAGLMAVQEHLWYVGSYAEHLSVVGPEPPWFHCPRPIDLFWSLGCLHHTPHAGELLRRACELLAPDGECRVVLYSDHRWRQMMGEEPPADTPRHPRFLEFVRKCDAVGSYADWYDEDKLRGLVGGFATVERCRYLGNDQFIGAVVRPKGK